MKTYRQQQRNGFTLVEVAIVLFFMGIFVSFASSMMKNIALSTKLRDARDKLTATSDAVQDWANKNRYLPTTAAFDTALAQPRDYWGKAYSFYPYAFPVGSVNEVCRMKSTTLAVCENGDCVNKRKMDIAFVLVSSGDNLTKTVPPAADIASCTAAGLTCIPLYEPNATLQYDDLYKYVTLVELKKTLGCVEADSGLKILSADLPRAKVGAAYDTAISADGGAPFNNVLPYQYKWCVKSALPAGLSATFTCPTYSTTAAASFSIATGSPTTQNLSGNPPVVISVKDANGATADKSFLLIIDP
jgi:prepilin-type N-terminal cleavage/methylation domain-containing protein